jgi:hypothetical protein
MSIVFNLLSIFTKMTIKNAVLSILEKFQASRNDDKYCFCLVAWKLWYLTGDEAWQLKRLLEKAKVSMEWVRRSRQKIQNEERLDLWPTNKTLWRRKAIEQKMIKTKWNWDISKKALYSERF